MNIFALSKAPTVEMVHQHGRGKSRWSTKMFRLINYPACDLADPGAFDQKVTILQG